MHAAEDKNVNCGADNYDDEWNKAFQHVDNEFMPIILSIIDDFIVDNINFFGIGINSIIVFDIIATAAAAAVSSAVGCASQSLLLPLH